jgi:hypothetical protein
MDIPLFDSPPGRGAPIAPRVGGQDQVTKCTRIADGAQGMAIQISSNDSNIQSLSANVLNHLKAREWQRLKGQGIAIVRQPTHSFNVQFGTPLL